MDNIFLEQPDLSSPNYYLDIRSGTHGAQTNAILTCIRNVLLKHRPGILLVQVDTNTVCT